MVWQRVGKSGILSWKFLTEFKRKVFDFAAGRIKEKQRISFKTSLII